MQNEELRRSRAEVEAGLERYTELYDFAPVGYLTLGRDGTIRQVNLTGAQLLGGERARLPGRRFGVLVAEPDRAASKSLSLLRFHQILRSNKSFHHPRTVLLFI